MSVIDLFLWFVMISCLGCMCVLSAQLVIALTLNSLSSSTTEHNRNSVRIVLWLCAVKTRRSTVIIYMLWIGKNWMNWNRREEPINMSGEQKNKRQHQHNYNNKYTLALRRQRMKKKRGEKKSNAKLLSRNRSLGRMLIIQIIELKELSQQCCDQFRGGRVILYEDRVQKNIPADHSWHSTELHRLRRSFL